MAKLQKIVPSLWFDDQAEEAAKLYVSIFPDSKIGRIVRYTKAGFETHRQPAGSVMTVELSLSGQDFIALNGGSVFQFNEAVSLMITCDTQQEIDYYWDKLTAHGGQEGPCGWCKDKFGLSWQVAPSILQEMLADPDTVKVERVTEAYLKMKKFDIEQLRQVFEGKN